MIAIISDIHGNYPALQAVLEDIDRIGIKKIICLGDMAGYYCFVNEVIDELRQRNIMSLKGNHDAYLLGEGSCPRSYTVNNCIEFQKNIIRQDNLDWLSKTEPSFMGDAFWAVHGGWDDPLDEYIKEFNFDNPKIKNSGYHLFFSGHSHIQSIQTQGNVLYCNPGSVGQPRDGNPMAAYAILCDDGSVELKRVEYNIDIVAEAMQRNGFEKKVYENLYRGLRIGEQYKDT